MPVREATAIWKGGFQDGEGTLRTPSGALDSRYSCAARFEDGNGTNPEELIGAAHAGCFSMALAKLLADAGHEPRSIETRARVRIEPADGGFSIASVSLSTRADVSELAEPDLEKIAEEAKAGCPVSKALAGTQISVAVALAGH